MSSPLWAVTCLFNPQRYARRIENYRVFRQQLAAPLLAVELSFDGRFELAANDADVLIRLQGGDVMWQKERLLNIGVGHLPPECDTVAFLDCDIVFHNPNWPAEARRALDQAVAVQPFELVRDLGRGFLPREGERSVIRLSRSIAAASAGSTSPDAPSLRVDQSHPRPGFAWVYRRDHLTRHGLYDRCVVGSGDLAMACASQGRFEAAELALRMSRAERSVYRAWAEPWHNDVRGQLGFVHGDIDHLWHGEFAHRRYDLRHQGLAFHNFDPVQDLIARPGEPWRWAAAKPGLRAFVRDYFAGRAEDGPDERDTILIARHPSSHPYDAILRWIEQHAPECLPRFTVKDLPVTLSPNSLVRAVVMWVQQPSQGLSPETHALAESLAGYYQARAVPIIHAARHTCGLSRQATARALSGAGFRVPRMAPFAECETFLRAGLNLGFPLLIRENRSGSSPVLMARTPEEARSIQLESFASPIAVEWIDTASPADGLFRKYRYVACAGLGYALDLQVCKSWQMLEAERVTTPSTIAEEEEYLSRPDPHRARFQSALRALRLDFAAFDYSCDRSGNVIVWKVDPFPPLEFDNGALPHRNRAVHRTIAGLVALYLKSADIEAPDSIRRLLAD